VVNGRRHGGEFGRNSGQSQRAPDERRSEPDEIAAQGQHVRGRWRHVGNPGRGVRRRDLTLDSLDNADERRDRDPGVVEPDHDSAENAVPRSPEDAILVLECFLDLTPLVRRIIAVGAQADLDVR